MYQFLSDLLGFHGIKFLTGIDFDLRQRPERAIFHTLGISATKGAHMFRLVCFHVGYDDPNPADFGTASTPDTSGRIVFNRQGLAIPV